jgi:hypothetical protein
MAEFESVTGWSARRRHLAEPGADYMLCARGAIVRAGSNLFAGAGRAPITQEKIDAMPLCKGCAQVAAKAGTE